MTFDELEAEIARNNVVYNYERVEIWGLEKH